MAFPSTVFGGFGSEKETSTTKKRALGTKLELPDGRIFRYALNGGVALTAGKIVAAPVPVANHDMDLAVASDAAVGAKSITVTLGATAATADQYADGYIYINDGAGEGQLFSISDHLAADASASLTVNLADTDKVAVALSTSTSLAGLQTSPFSAVVVTPTSVTNRTVGVPAGPIAADAYGWVQTRGPAAVLISGTVVLGEPVRVAGATTAGAVMALDRDGSGENEQYVGDVMAPVAVTTDYGFVNLALE